MLAPGDSAPDFSLPADDGSTVALEDLRGSRVVIYFYPKNDTPGCTRQACAIRDSYADFGSANAKVFGISRDDAASHRAFREKFALPFPLLSDPDHEVATAYGVWGPKTSYGKTTMGINRSAFVIDEEGRITAALYGIKPEATTTRSLAALAG